MKYFIVEIKYKVPFDKLSGIIEAHRSFLDTGYKNKMLLCSGPQNPKTGGIVVARANNEEEIREYFDNDPYHTQKVAEHNFIEFTPVKFQEFLKDWIVP
jgi:uncharacterized protein YciI